MTVDAASSTDRGPATADSGKHTTRPPRAMVGAQAGGDEKIFGRVFDGRVFKRFWEFLRPYRRRLAVGVGVVGVFTLTQLSIPLLVRHAVDYAMLPDAGGVEVLGLVVIAFFIMALIGFGANIAQELIVGRVAESLLVDLRRAMFAHLQEVSLGFLDKTEVGRIMSRLQGDVAALQEFLETSVLAIGDLVLLVGIAAVLLWLDPLLGALTLAVAPALFLVRFYWLPRARKAFIRAREASSEMNGALAEGIMGVRTVQAMRREALNLSLFQRKVDEFFHAQLHSTRLAQAMIPTVDTLTGCAMAVVVLVGGHLVGDGHMNVGVMIAFLLYVQRFFDPIRSITLQYSVMQRAMASGHRIFEVLDVPRDIQEKPDARPMNNVKGAITFDRVSFGYDSSAPVIQDLSFHIEPGESVALIGPTGSGKTSVVSLLRRFHDVQEGAVRIDGRDVRDMTLDSLSGTIGMALQDPYLFTGTIIENIRYASSDADDETVKEAARAVGADDFIKDLPEGYDTPVGPQGRSLSAGQRQLISFARAMVRRPPILVLDEATANIDSFTEKKIQDGLKVLLKDRTGLVIAHRLATIRNADRILVLDQGRLIEQGAHAELIAKDGLYAKLYRLNITSFDDLSEGASAKDPATS